jgi:hypothetical protein
MVVLGALISRGMAHAECDSTQFFSPPVAYQVGGNPFTLATGDFNRDGVPDLAVVDNGSATVSILLGNGNGTFGAATSYAVGSGPGHIAVGDLDHDGFLDVVTNSSGTNNMSILLGHGDGTFAPRVLVAAGPTPYGFALADFNGDGNLDIAAANFIENTVAILIGHGNGGFDVPRVDSIGPAGTQVGARPYFVAAGDFNHDGITDLVVTNQDSYDVSILIGHGDGSFAHEVRYAVREYPYCVALGDYNHDGITDLAVANAGAGNVSILLGRGAAGVGDGTFSPSIVYPAGFQPRWVSSADVDGDGVSDLVVADYNSRVQVLHGNGAAGAGDGTFAAPLEFVVGGTPTGLTVADLDHDGDLDVAVANYEGSSISVLIHGCGTPPPPPPPPPSPAPAITAVRDVPHDQGGRLFVTWLRSAKDADGAYPLVTQYRVWQRIPAATAALIARSSGARIESNSYPVRALRSIGPDADSIVTYWQAAAVFPAERLDGYGYTATTTRDSSADGNPYTAFFVTAATADPSVFFESKIDSGYSVDNLAPDQPTSFAVAYEQGRVALHWSSNRESDLREYRIYRSSFEGFEASESNWIGSTSDTAYVDAAGTLGSFYELAAVDQHGNQSRVAAASTANPTGALVSVLSAEVKAGRVELAWLAKGLDRATVYRAGANGDWKSLADVSADGTGRMTYADRDLIPNARYGYRLGFRQGGSELSGPETWIQAPGLSLALGGAIPNPSRTGVVAIGLVLPADDTASFEVIDLAGRRVASQRLVGAGSHTIEIGRESPLASGVYVVRLSQQGRSVRTKINVLR